MKNLFLVLFCFSISASAFAKNVICKVTVGEVEVQSKVIPNVQPDTMSKIFHYTDLASGIIHVVVFEKINEDENYISLYEASYFNGTLILQSMVTATTARFLEIKDKVISCE